MKKYFIVITMLILNHLIISAQSDNNNSISNLSGSNLNDLYFQIEGLHSVKGELYSAGLNPWDFKHNLMGINLTNPFNGRLLYNIPTEILKNISYNYKNPNVKEEMNLGGIINYELIDNSESNNLSINYWTDNVTFAKNTLKAEKFFDTYSYGFNNFNLLANGSITDNLFYLINYNYNFKRDKNPQNYPGFDPENIIQNEYPEYQHDLTNGLLTQNHRFTNNLLINLNYVSNKVNLNLTGIYEKATEQFNNSPIYRIYNDRKPLSRSDFWAVNLSGNVKISKKMEFSFNAGYKDYFYEKGDPVLMENIWEYGDSLSNKEYSKYFTSRYSIPGMDGLFNDILFYNEGRPFAMYIKKNFNSLSVNSNIEYIFSKKSTFSINLNYVRNIKRYWTSTEPFKLARNLNFWQNNHPELTNTETLEKALIYNHKLYKLGYKTTGEKSDKPNIANNLVINLNEKIKFGNATVIAGLRIDNYFGQSEDKFKLNGNNISDIEIIKNDFATTDFLPYLNFSYNFNKNITANTYFFTNANHWGFVNSSFTLFQSIGGEFSSKNLQANNTVLSKNFGLNLTLNILKNLTANINYDIRIIDGTFENISKLVVVPNMHVNIMNYDIIFSKKSNYNFKKLLVSFNYNSNEFKLINTFEYSKFVYNNLFPYGINLTSLLMPGEFTANGLIDLNSREGRNNTSNDIFFNNKLISNKLSVTYYTDNSNGLLSNFLIALNYVNYFDTPLTSSFYPYDKNISQLDFYLSKSISINNILNFEIYFNVQNIFDSKYEKNIGYEKSEGAISLANSYGEFVYSLYEGYSNYDIHNYPSYVFTQPRQIILGAKLNF